MEKLIEDYSTQVNSHDIRKIISKMDSLQASFQTMENRGPYKSKVTPHRERYFRRPYDHPPNFRTPNGKKEYPIQNKFRNSRFKP